MRREKRKEERGKRNLEIPPIACSFLLSPFSFLTFWSAYAIRV